MLLQNRSGRNVEGFNRFRINKTGPCWSGHREWRPSLKGVAVFLRGRGVNIKLGTLKVSILVLNGGQRIKERLEFLLVIFYT